VSGKNELRELVEEADEIGCGLWAGIRRVLAVVGEATGLAPLWDFVATRIADWGAAREPVAFTVALIALSAKMARADGVVSIDEVEMFRRLVEVPEGEERNVERLFDIAQRDVAGFDLQARRIGEIARGDEVFLGDVLEGLFHIAAADGFVHERELAFLERVGEIFALSEAAFERIASGFVRRRRGRDPYRLLGVSPQADDETVRRAWRKLVAECHPDRHLAHGLPKEAIAILTDRTAALNAAWEEIRQMRGLGRALAEGGTA
jgi:DnaJ like chaperone protein